MPDVKKSMDVSTPLAFAGDSLSAGQSKVTCRCMQQLLYCIDIDTVDIAAQLNPQQAVLVIRVWGVLYVTSMTY